jgi:hypothetical protein
VDQRAPADLEIIHVADAEFDDGLSLRMLSALPARNRFVVRGNLQRAVQMRNTPWLPRNRERPSKQHLLTAKKTPDLVDAYLVDAVRELPMTPWKELAVDARGRVCDPSARTHHTARLSVGAFAVLLPKRSNRAMDASIPEAPIWLNVIVIRETNPRPKHKPLEWVLLTNLPVETLEQITRVAEIYAVRWRIEEFFRTAKDVLDVEKSELETADSTARLLFFVTLKVMFLDTLRREAGLHSGVAPSDEQRRQLKEAARHALEIEKGQREKPTAMTFQQRALTVIALAVHRVGWINRRNAHLGNYILLEGLRVVFHDLAEDRFGWLLDSVG